MLRKLIPVLLGLCLFTYSFYVFEMSKFPLVYSSGSEGWGIAHQDSRKPLCESYQSEPIAIIVPKPQIKQSRIVFLKTHKTASTTLASMMFRFGHRHGLRFLPPNPDHYINLFDETIPAGPFDITLYHHRLSNDPNPNEELYYYEKMKRWYDSRVPDAQYVSVLRDPVKRQLSEYYYFFQPENVTVEQFIAGDHPTRDRSDVNRDLGVFTIEAAKKYIESDFDGVFMAITEMLPESLMLLRQKLGWSLQDMLYMHLLDACKGDNVTRWDGKQVQCAPKNPPTSLVEAIKGRTHIEQMIYDAARAKIERLVKAQPPQFLKDLTLFKQMLNELQDRCKGFIPANTPETNLMLSNTSLALSIIPIQCYIYLIPDMVYQKLIQNAYQQNVTLNSFLPLVEYY